MKVVEKHEEIKSDFNVFVHFLALNFFLSVSGSRGRGAGGIEGGMGGAARSGGRARVNHNFHPPL